ncbi:pectin acetylesterase-family hydrolase [Truepera radiovictrix]|uniref:Pectinacetylesterase, putative n=1 Tax=Truepera radiovictrix (strain DSM 17093 / CIP 108686 / LMG 22925 / RQ-24) TaxID=649638 RepID=D7CW41_TRURR|nr:pectin acetylesterase-family hydrolase [Truepera radiovictrix]ADI14304.1 pectinacetylesterase, putative [Truepera radiovictrix DSM 17093]WMT57140.1 pectin acetylesterase-family hydrolase [Truepera radiovictrix]
MFGLAPRGAHGLLALVLLLGACVQPPVDPSPDPEPPAAAPTLPDLTPGVWTALSPGGETTCSDGSPYTFFVRPGTVNKVVVDFEGGGACWNDGTCGPNGPYQPNLAASMSARYREENPTGLYDKSNPENPVRDWYHVFVSYCTADVHLGDSVETYTTPQGERTVYHKGQANVRAVLAWMAEHFSAPEAVFVTGCSAGAYGAALYTAELAAMYPEADVSQMGDCGAGIIPESFVQEGLNRWNIEGALPAGVDLEEGVPATFLADAYVVIGQQFPEARLSQYNSAFDGVQIAFYARMLERNLQDPEALQEVAEAWFTGLVTSLQGIQVELPSFSSYTSLLDDNDDLQDGTAHCLLFRPEFYTLVTSEVRFVDWLGDLIAGESGQTVFTPLPEALEPPVAVGASR